MRRATSRPSRQAVASTYTKEQRKTSRRSVLARRGAIVAKRAERASGVPGAEVEGSWGLEVAVYVLVERLNECSTGGRA
jgi:hypothetical protein